MVVTGENRSTARKYCPIATVSTTDPPRTRHGKPNVLALWDAYVKPYDSVQQFRNICTRQVSVRTSLSLGLTARLVTHVTCIIRTPNSLKWSNKPQVDRRDICIADRYARVICWCVVSTSCHGYLKGWDGLQRNGALLLLRASAVPLRFIVLPQPVTPLLHLPLAVLLAP